MKYAIFGAAGVGYEALQYLGAESISCVVDNNKAGEVWHDYKVMSYDDFLAQHKDAEDLCILVASSKYIDDIVSQIKSSGYHNYRVYGGNAVTIGGGSWKRIWSVSERLPAERFCNVHSVAIYGRQENEFYIKNKIEDYDGIENVDFIDDSADLSKYQLVVVNELIKNSDIRAILTSKNIDYIDYVDYFIPLPITYKNDLINYKNIHKGKRIFVIGNGPSLKIEDLETLHRNGEITICANKLYRIYGETDFRATYLAFTDHRMIEDCLDAFTSIPGIKFVNDIYWQEHVEDEQVHYFNEVYDDFLPNHPKFSDDIVKCVYWGSTVTYEVGIQFAAYMGASEIYLLGVDHNFVGPVTNPDNHFIKDYYMEKGTVNHDYSDGFQKEKVTSAYEMAEIYSRSHGFRVFNATRGGKLEVFERVNFDDLFPEKKTTVGSNIWTHIKDR